MSGGICRREGAVPWRNPSCQRHADFKWRAFGATAVISLYVNGVRRLPVEQRWPARSKPLIFREIGVDGAGLIGPVSGQTVQRNLCPSVATDVTGCEQDVDRVGRRNR